jgi:hypothetical protein
VNNVRESREQLRFALRDELATIRALNASIRAENNSVSDDSQREVRKLKRARAVALKLVRDYLTLLHPGQNTPKKTPARKPRAPRK